MAILAGGVGSRLSEETDRDPKPTVVEFNEKSQTEEGWINGAFFVVAASPPR